MKRLRIFASVLCGVGSVFLMLLWLRSYRRADSIFITVGRDNTGIESRQGRLLPIFQQLGAGSVRWRFHTGVIDQSFPKTPHAPFSWHNDLPSYFWVCIPHWFVATLMAMLAVAPWIKWSRRFNIRTLLIATTLLAVLLRLAVLHRQLG